MRKLFTTLIVILLFVSTMGFTVYTPPDVDDEIPVPKYVIIYEDCSIYAWNGCPFVEKVIYSVEELIEFIRNYSDRSEIFGIYLVSRKLK